jgi:stage V sporulation protein G
MEITEIRVFPVDEEKLKAFVSVVFDDCFIVSDIKIINGNNGLFLSMPSKKGKNGKFRDIAHPLNSDMRGKMEQAIIAEYNTVVTEGTGRAAEDIPLESESVPEEEKLSTN